MSEDRFCEMSGCDGALELDDTFPLQTGCSSCTQCCACSKCGRVHSISGELMFSRQGPALYVIEGNLEWILEPKEFVPGKVYQTTSYIYVFEDDDYEEIEPETKLTFEMMDDEVFCFTSEVGKKYRLDRADVNFIEEAQGAS